MTSDPTSSSGSASSSLHYFNTIEENEDAHAIDKIYQAPTDDVDPIGIIIDNGSYHCRAGWTTMENPALSFRPLCAKLKAADIKNLDFVSDEDKLVLYNGGYLVGNDLHPLDYIRYNAKSPFDNDIVTNFEYFEQVMDYVFYKLGLTTSSLSLKDIPLVFTEPILNPLFSRQSTLEILFECYGIPSINLSVDSLLSMQETFGDSNIFSEGSNALVVRSGFHATHVFPIINGVPQWKSCKRLNLGGFHATDLMLKLMQLKYPNLVQEQYRKYFVPLYDVLGIPALSVTKAEYMKENYCYFSQHYSEELNRMSEDKSYFDQSTVRIFNNKAQYESFLNHVQNAATSSATSDVSDSSVPTFKNLSECEAWLATKRDELQQLQFKVQSMQFELSCQTKDHTLKSKRSAASKQRQKAKIAAEIHEAEDDTFDDWSLYDGLANKKKKKKKKSKDDVVDAKKVKKVTNQIEELKKLIIETEIKYLGGQKTDLVKSHYMSQYMRNSEDLTDNSGIRLTVERIRVPEIIFQPHIAAKEQIGLAEIIDNTLQEFDSKQRLELVRNIFICGGNTAFTGFKTRLENEVRQLMPSGSEIRIINEANFDTSAWRGGRSLLINHSNNDSYWMKLSDYQEQGSDRMVLHSHPFSNIS